MASFAASADCAFVDPIGKADGADGKTRKRFRKQRFRPAIKRLGVQNDITRARECEDRGRNRRHAGREQGAFLRALVDSEPVLDDLAVRVIEPRIDQARAHPLGRLAPACDEVEVVLSVFGGPEHEGRGQEHGRFHGAFGQLRIVTVVQHQRFGMQHVIADVGLRCRRFHHGLSRCSEFRTAWCKRSNILDRFHCAPRWNSQRRGQASTATFSASVRISSTSRSFSLTNSGVVLIL